MVTRCDESGFYSLLNNGNRLPACSNVIKTLGSLFITTPTFISLACILITTNYALWCVFLQQFIWLKFRGLKASFQKGKRTALSWLGQTHGATDWPSNLSDVLSCWLSTEPRSASANLSNTFCYIIIIIIMSSCSSRSSSIYTEFSKYTNAHNISSVSWWWKTGLLQYFTVKNNVFDGTSIGL